jgi:PIN domain nuclease of toxin-antitoxin system
VNRYVVDTHALLWYLARPSRVGAGARRALERAEEGEAHVTVPALVVAEMLMVAQKGRIPGFTTAEFDMAMGALRDNGAYELSNLTPERVLLSRSLTAIPDIFDRLIVAEALALGVPVLTADPVIGATGYVPVLWDT